MCLNLKHATAQSVSKNSQLINKHAPIISKQFSAKRPGRLINNGAKAIVLNGHARTDAIVIRTVAHVEQLPTHLQLRTPTAVVTQHYIINHIVRC